jgi:hypothetical protein
MTSIMNDLGREVSLARTEGNVSHMESIMGSRLGEF